MGGNPPVAGVFSYNTRDVEATGLHGHGAGEQGAVGGCEKRTAPARGHDEASWSEQRDGAVTVTFGAKTSLYSVVLTYSVVDSQTSRVCN